MHPPLNPDALRRLQALIARETGAPLPDAAQAELQAILHGQPDPTGAEGAASGLAPVPREVTILLADLRGATALSNPQPVPVQVAALNRCLARLFDVVARYGGTIDKLMGDAIVVLFGVPDTREDDVERALACAVEMQIAMRELNLVHLTERLPEVSLGIGVNTGTVMAGRFGSGVYSENTVIGEAVHLAARIESLSLRGQVLMSDVTYQRSGGLVSASEPMEAYVKGREQPVALRELIAIPSRRLKVPRQEFRRSHRVDAHLPCQLRRVEDNAVLPHIVHGSIRDIGYQGMLVELLEPIKPHCEVKLDFELPLVDYRTSDVYARVVTLKPEGDEWVAGLEFTHMNAECQAKVQAFVHLLVSR